MGEVFVTARIEKIFWQFSFILKCLSLRYLLSLNYGYYDYAPDALAELALA